MNASRLVAAGLRHYRRAHLALMLAAAVGVAVLAGSLLVGSSVKGSLREHALERLGNVDEALVAADYFKAALAGAVPRSAPAIMTPASASHAESGATAAHVQALGVDARFWELMGAADAWGGIGEDDAVINEALASRLRARVGDEILLRAQKPSAVPRETFIGEREETVATLRLTVKKIVPGKGNFSLTPAQADPLNVFVPLGRLGRRLEQPGRANAILAAANTDAQAKIDRAADLDDVGIKVAAQNTPATPGHAFVSVESAQIFLPRYTIDLATQAAASLHARCRPTLTYLANAMIAGGRMTPYSTVAALDDLDLGPGEIALNAWTADDLAARVGDRLRMTYFLPTAGRFVETTATLTVARIVPMTSPLVASGLAPDFPGIADAETIGSWNPPFPLDMKRIRPKDEAYWDKYRAAPKAFVSLATGRRLWANPYGDATSIRVEGVAAPALQKAMRERLDPARAGLRLEPVRRRAIEASRGASDFAGLFVGFSFFLLMASAMLIHALFQLGVQARAREFGILSAIGLRAPLIRNLMLAEGGIIAAAGGVIGLLLGTGYAALLIHGLRTWWIGAVGAPFLRLHVDAASLAGGLVGGLTIAMISIVIAARGLAKQGARGLLAGRAADEACGHSRGRMTIAISICFLIVGISLASIAPSRPAEEQAGMFFGAGAGLLVAALTLCRAWLRGNPRPARPERLSIARLGLAAARRRPGRSMLVVGLMACATFIIVAVGAQRQAPPATSDKRSGAGGFALLAESALPIYHPLDPQLPGGARAWPIRLEAGDDPSCLNLYQSARPRVAGVSDDFIRRGGFAFSQTLARDDRTKANPWLLLGPESEATRAGDVSEAFPDGAIPAIGDANTVMWLLHSGLGRDVVVDGTRFRFVALLRGSIFQSELIVSERNFVRLFPREAGWRLFAIETPGDPRPLAARIESFYQDFGLGAVATRDRLAALLAVENTYLSIFMALGGLGLLLGTVGMALALLRNLVERRREFALLRAVGFRFGQLVWLTSSENIVLILIGMAIGAAAALVAVLPASIARSAPLPWLDLIVMLCAVAAIGAGAVVAGTAAVLRSPAIKVLKED
ncbi:MAG: FtsX-like permease family protein [Candidatus Sumerlaeia bacterium]